MSSFYKALEKYIGYDNLKKIKKVKVGIAGAGGLGSNCAQYLVRSGFKQLVLADFDMVDYTNLNRQFYFLHQVGMHKVEALEMNLKNINPGIAVTKVTERLNKDSMGKYFADCHVVVEAFDDPRCKRELVETFMSTGKLVVAASGIAGWGRSDEIKVRRVKNNLYVVGDFVSEVRENCPPVSPRVNIVAAKQADIVLNWVINEMDI